MATGNTLAVFTAVGGAYPSSNYATPDLRNAHPVLDFDASTEESCYFEGVLPDTYAGGGLTVELYWMATSATSGDVKWGGSIERMHSNGDDLDSDSFASEQTDTTTTNGTSGKVTKSAITFSSGSNMDSLAAGEPFRLKVARKAADVADTMTGDAELSRIVVKET
ncbi:MAG: hypothetical protein E6R03_11170 [Hyphomicrobiaceae bacterium]|nr:MAG: hypothetical protein E6R03_11170 [Hyphomicrobiaceae bacterium]